jgi:SAM-dependent methyltransferase
VLDAPCGTGRDFPMVADNGCQVVGIDQFADMLNRARAAASRSDSNPSASRTSSSWRGSTPQ